MVFLSVLLFVRDDVERRFEGKLSKNMSGSLYEMVSRVMKALVNRKITVPGNFQGYVAHTLALKTQLVIACVYIHTYIY